VDTGASDSFITKKVAEQIGLKLSKVNIAPVEMGGGASTEILGRMECRLIIHEHRSTRKFFVLSELAGYDAILGEDWLRNHDVALCYKGLGRCTVKKGPVRIVLETWAETEIREGRDLWERTKQPVKNPPRVLHLRFRDSGKKPRNESLPRIEESEAGELRSQGERVIAGKVDAAGKIRLNIISTHQFKRDERKGCRTFQVVVRPQLLTTVAGQELPADIHPGIEELLIKYPRSVMEIPPELPPMRHTAHTIPIQPGEGPSFRPMYRLSPLEKVEVEKQVAELLRRGWIVPSVSPWGAPILFVVKRDGTLRMVIDYRGANKVTVRNRYPLPRIDDLLDKLHGAKHFTSLDLQSGYNQVRISEEDVPKTAFNTHIGHYEFKVLSFGLANAPSLFQSLMNEILGPVLGKYCLVYMDDILIYSRTMEEHLVHVEAVLKLLVENKLYAKLSKCRWAQSSTGFLGHVIGEDGIRVDPRKVEVVKEWPTPSNAGELRSFIGLATYFRKFIRGFSGLTHPLHGLLRTKEPVPPWEWTEECQTAFDAIKEGLISAPVLACPDFSEGAPEFEVVCDASLVAVGAILTQGGRAIAYESRALIPAEKNYTAGEIELLAVVHAMKTWRCYLEGVKCRVVTDHCPLRYLKTQPNLSRRQTRWSEYLQMYDFEWEYRPGKTNPADSLSRLERYGTTLEDREATLLHLNRSTRKPRPPTHVGIGYEGTAMEVEVSLSSPVVFVRAEEEVDEQVRHTQFVLPKVLKDPEVERTLRALGYVKTLLKMDIAWSVKLPGPPLINGARPFPKQTCNAQAPPDYAVINLRGELLERSQVVTPDPLPTLSTLPVAETLPPPLLHATPAPAGAPVTPAPAGATVTECSEIPRDVLKNALRKVLTLQTTELAQEGKRSVRLANKAERRFRLREEETAEALRESEKQEITQLTAKDVLGKNTGRKTKVHGAPAPPLTFEEVNAEPEATAGKTIGDVLERCRVGYAKDEWFQDEANLIDLHKSDYGLYTFNGATVVPNSQGLREDILEEIHNTVYGGHLGGQRTFEQVSRLFWWPGHRVQVLKHVQECASCQANKTGHRLPTGLLQNLPVPERRWESVSLDFITGLPITKGGNTQIVVFIDRLTKMTHLAALKEDATAMDVVRVFRREVFRLHGLPRNLVSDRDAKFTSQLWKDIFRLLGTKLNMTTAYHPQGDGQVENMNKTLEDMLRAWVCASLNDWDELLDCAEFAINNAYNASVKNTPFRLNYGQNPLTPLSMLAESQVVGAVDFAKEVRQNVVQTTQLLKEVREKEVEQGVNPRVLAVETRKFRDDMQQSLKAAKQALDKAQARQKQSFDEKHRHQEFKEGSKVLLRTTNLRFKGPNARKLLPKWIGPFVVEKRYSELTYKLTLPACMKAYPCFHTSLLKPYFENARNPPPIAMEEEDYPIFMVEAMLEMKEVKARSSGKGTQKPKVKYSYLVKWEGFGREHNSWEPESSFEGRKGCMKLIAQLKDSLKRKAT